MQYIQEIKTLLAQARQKTYQAINSMMVETYWKIGEKIVLEEQNGKNRANYGEAVLKTLSVELSAEFGKGFSYANLRNIRQFYYTYPDFEICYTLCSKLTWSHNRLIMRVENTEARKFYLTEAAQQQWSVRALERNINTFYYQRLLSNQNEKSNTYEILNIENFIKDPYVFEFLNIPETHQPSEKELENNITKPVQ